jgi:hypothetical protein
MNILALINTLSNRSKIEWHYTIGCAIREYLTEYYIMLVTMSILIPHCILNNHAKQEHINIRVLQGAN